SSWDTDNGADFFINAGQRFLDRRFETAKTYGRRFDSVAAGSYYQVFQNCRAISEVWCNDDEERWQLKRYDKITIRENFPDLVSAIDSGPPLYYMPLSLRSIDATDMTSLGTFLDYVKTDDDGTYNGILFVPPTDGTYVIETVGKFFHDELSDNDDENYWTTVSPDTLIKAALYQLEVSYRNTEGAKDWLNALTIEGKDMEFDLVEEESNEGRVIE
ncbi:MAG: hypothetical protein KKH70_20415, partial [Gammaproteobacteria bacterium]|nr:hypothetical protein [Gammaproteobacteria bacterium]